MNQHRTSPIDTLEGVTSGLWWIRVGPSTTTYGERLLVDLDKHTLASGYRVYDLTSIDACTVGAPASFAITRAGTDTYDQQYETGPVTSIWAASNA